MGPVPLVSSLSSAPRLLAALLAAVVVVLAGPAVTTASGATANSASVPAAPCTCTGTVQEHVKSAPAVFTGTVQTITPTGGNAENGFSRTSTVEVERVYKGEMITTATVDVVTPRAFGRCTRDLVVDESYVFFAEADEALTATGCGGTRPKTDGLVTQVERLLGAGRTPVPAEPPTATIDPVETEEPASLTRVAAPGVALILVGLLGLAVVRRLARPRR